MSLGLPIGKHLHVVNGTPVQVHELGVLQTYGPYHEPCGISGPFRGHGCPTDLHTLALAIQVQPQQWLLSQGVGLHGFVTCALVDPTPISSLSIQG